MHRALLSWCHQSSQAHVQPSMATDYLRRAHSTLTARATFRSHSDQSQSRQSAQKIRTTRRRPVGSTAQWCHVCCGFIWVPMISMKINQSMPLPTSLFSSSWFCRFLGLPVSTFGGHGGRSQYAADCVGLRVHVLLVGVRWLGRTTEQAQHRLCLCGWLGLRRCRLQKPSHQESHVRWVG